MDYTAVINTKDHRIPHIQPTAFYIPEFLTANEENIILSNIYAVPKPKWTQLSNRRLQNWGGIPHVKGMIAENIPQWLEIYLEKIHQLHLMDGKKPNHVLVNEYLPGQGIMPHLDGSLFYPTITTVSLGSHSILKFLEPSKEEGKNAKYIHRGVVNHVIAKRNYSSAAPPPKNDPNKEDKAEVENISGDGNKKGLVIGVYEADGKFELTPAAAEVDQKSGGKLCRHLNEAKRCPLMGDIFDFLFISNAKGDLPLNAVWKETFSWSFEKKGLRFANNLIITVSWSRGPTKPTSDYSEQ
ncbi:unnamed protein product [Diatraea saccharalis]|uniref:Alpha-ketoglutarate-dependent dioxygenase AlkB-like domain-containing protein n=1 Tax=Diatraea saccharalis TaxID=40085 RepID=A0A9N9R1C7_9NEOP|nr:unnamed protein product [Diatraea saccharalis]